MRMSYLCTQRADTTADPNFAEFCDWLEHHKWRRSTVTGAVAGMAAGAGMVGAKVSSNIQFWKLNLECKKHDKTATLFLIWKSIYFRYPRTSSL